MSWRTGAALAMLVGLSLAPGGLGVSPKGPGGLARTPPTTSRTQPQRKLEEAVRQGSLPRAAARATLADTREVRAVAACGEDAWVATRGGVERYTRPGWARRLYGTTDGLDTLDVRRVECAGPSVLVETAFSRCAREGDRFACRTAALRTPDPPRAETFQGAAVTARTAAAGGMLVGTAADGVYWVPDEGAPTLLTPDRGPASFVRAVAAFAGKLWLGTFTDGLYEADAALTGGTRKVSTPFRMVNGLLAVRGGLYVAANEGVFVTRDGARWQRISDVTSRGVTGVATDGHVLYATTTSALWRLPLDPRGPRPASWWKPAGSRSLQGVVASRTPDGTNIWLASEDRGVIRFDGRSFVAFDKLSGLPSSWVVAIEGDGHGGAYAVTLRDGAMHVGGGGGWELLEGLPSSWGLAVTRADGLLCIGTQDGAACYDEAPSARRAGAAWLPAFVLEGLPDPRVHVVAGAAGMRLLAGTEAGLAVVERPS